jgi:HPt (histidine-containing phosphotransfer) domain-containing protein
VNEKLYDLTMVHSVSGGDETFIKKMVALFIETVPPNVADLSTATKTENWDQVAKLAHKLKSTVDSMGIRSLKTEIRAVEANAKQKVSLEEIPALVQKIETVIGNCVAQLKVDFME